MDAAATEPCFHCGAPLAGAVPCWIEIDGLAQPLCCSGCEAAARLILGQGLERYYAFRTAAPRPAPAGGRDWSVYDRTQALRRYTHARGDGLTETSLQIDGMHCAACAWLIENSLRRIEGVRDIHVNPGSSRAEAVFDAAAVPFGTLLEHVERLGYRPQPLSFTAQGPEWMTERRTALKRLGVAGFGMMQVMTYAVSLYAGAMDGIAPDLEQLLRWVSLLVSTPVVLYAGWPFFAAAWRGLRARTLGMDLPVALSIGAAYTFSVYATLRGRGQVYFDSAVMFTFLLSLGRYIEMSLRHRAGLQHDALARLLPDGALKVAADGVTTERVTPEELAAGDRVRVLAGERIPADGLVLDGGTEVDESLLTGESAPRSKAAGDPLIAGTLNLSSAIDIEVRRVGQDSTLAAVSRMLERAQSNRPRIADVADGVAAWFVGGVLLLAAAVGLYWLHVDAGRAFSTVLAVLVVTCPCALSLATPAALAAGSARLARGGLLITRGRAIEILARADMVVFDKTGTLTRGEPVIARAVPVRAGVRIADCLATAAARARHAGPPRARGVGGRGPGAGGGAGRSPAGRGIEAVVAGARHRLGRADFVLELGAGGGDRESCTGTGPEAAADETAVWLGDERGPLAVFLLTDGLRPDAPAALQALVERGLEVSIASGDRQAVVAAVARRLGVAQARGDLRPEAKLEWVRTLQSRGRVVAMVGDGVNDAPVLAGADVSVAVGGGSDLAKVSADVVLLGDSLSPLAGGIDTARHTMRVIRQNLAWAVLYNATAVPFAAAGWLQPWMAAIGMSASSLLVVANAMRLLKAGRRRARSASEPVAHRAAVRA